MDEIKLKTINAYDEKGNIFPKEINVYEGVYGLTFSFGYPEYNFNSLYRDLIENENKWEEFTIDFGGRNHKGSEVNVKMSEVVECLKLAKEKLNLVK